MNPELKRGGIAARLARAPHDLVDVIGDDWIIRHGYAHGITQSPIPGVLVSHNLSAGAPRLSWNRSDRCVDHRQRGLRMPREGMGQRGLTI